MKRHPTNTITIAGVQPELRASNAPLTPQPQVSHSNNLNRSSTTEILDCLSLVSLDQLRNLRNIERKLELYPDRFNESHYQARANMLILSDWPQAQEFASCCANRNGFKKCNRYHFCPYCCYRKRRKALQTYLRAFPEGTWHFVTVSFAGAVRFEETPYACLDYWDACNAAMRSLVNYGKIRGAFWIEEIQVLEFLPLRVMPHIHALVDGEWLEEAQQQIQNVLAEYRDTNDEGLMLTPSIRVDPIATQRSLLNRINYMFKPVNMVAPYENAWPRAEANERKLARSLNSELRDLVTGYSAMTLFRNKIYAKGTLTAKNRRFIGVRASDRHQQDELITSLQHSPDEFYDAPACAPQ